MTPMTLKRARVQRSASTSDDHRNLVNMIAPESPKGFRPTRKRRLSIVRPQISSHTWVQRSRLQKTFSKNAFS